MNLTLCVKFSYNVMTLCERIKHLNIFTNDMILNPSKNITELFAKETLPKKKILSSYQITVKPIHLPVYLQSLCISQQKSIRSPSVPSRALYIQLPIPRPMFCFSIMSDMNLTVLSFPAMSDVEGIKSELSVCHSITQHSQG